VTFPPDSAEPAPRVGNYLNAKSLSAQIVAGGMDCFAGALGGAGERGLDTRPAPCPLPQPRHGRTSPAAGLLGRAALAEGPRPHGRWEKGPSVPSCLLQPWHGAPPCPMATVPQPAAVLLAVPPAGGLLLRGAGWFCRVGEFGVTLVHFLGLWGFFYKTQQCVSLT